MAAKFKTKRKRGKKRTSFVGSLKVRHSEREEIGVKKMSNSFAEKQQKLETGQTDGQEQNGSQQATSLTLEDKGEDEGFDFDKEDLEDERSENGQRDIAAIPTQKEDVVAPDLLLAGTDTNGSNNISNKSEAGQAEGAEGVDLLLAGKDKETKIHLVDGEKGGVGKSLLCRVMMEYSCDNSLAKDIYFLESDLSNPDVGTIYFGESYQTTEFSTEERKRDNADKVFELAMKKSVIINLPSNIYVAVTDWMERNQVIKLGQENKISVVKWFLCTGGHASIEKFKESVKQFGDTITHVFVRNKVIYDDWSAIESDEELSNLIKANGVLEMDFPRLDFAERNKIDAKQLTFGQALKHKDFTLLSKQRIRNFLRDTYSGFDQLGLLP